MKKIIYLLAGLTLFFTATSFMAPEPAPKLYPELEAYFKSVQNAPLDKKHLESLEGIKYTLSITQMDYLESNFVFYCSENTFRSQVSQVFAETLGYARRFKKVNFYSAGLTTGEISPQLIAYLKKIGYKIDEVEKDGQKSFSVRFSDNADPITLFSKSVSDSSLPQKELISIVVCDTLTENNCKALKTATSPYFLAFEKSLNTDGETKVASLVNKIATEIAYVTKK